MGLMGPPQVPGTVAGAVARPSMILLIAVQCSTIFGLVSAAAVALSLPQDAAAALQEGIDGVTGRSTV